LPLTRRILQLETNPTDGLPNHLKNFVVYQNFNKKRRKQYTASLNQPSISPMGLKNFFARNLKAQKIPQTTESKIYYGGFRGCKGHNVSYYSRIF